MVLLISDTKIRAVVNAIKFTFQYGSTYIEISADTYNEIE